MTHFTPLNDLPVYDLYSEMLVLLSDNLINWKQNQICINTTQQDTDNIHLGVGSLWYDWNNASKVTDADGNIGLHVPERAVPLKESDFDTVATPFVGSLFEEVYNSVSRKFHIGRMRIMRSLPKTCLTWHVDDTKRLHYPMFTQEGAMMVIETEVMFLPHNTWWLADTLKPHTAFNGGTGSRIHLVTEIINER